MWNTYTQNFLFFFRTSCFNYLVVHQLNCEIPLIIFDDSSIHLPSVNFKMKLPTGTMFYSMSFATKLDTRQITKTMLHPFKWHNMNDSCKRCLINDLIFLEPFAILGKMAIHMPRRMWYFSSHSSLFKWRFHQCLGDALLAVDAL